MNSQFIYLLFGLLLNCLPTQCIIPLWIIPEDVATGLAGIYGFTPRIVIGRDHRYGFGFRFGNHADFQVITELGPQTYTRPLQQVPKIRSATYRERIYRRRPLLELLLRAGLVREARYDVELHDCDHERYEPR